MPNQHHIEAHTGFTIQIKGFIFYSIVGLFLYFAIPLCRSCITFCCRSKFFFGTENESNITDKTFHNDVITLCSHHNVSGIDNKSNTKSAVVGKIGKTLVEPGFFGIERDGGSFGALPSRQFYGGLTCLKFSAVPLNTIHDDVKPTEFEECKDFAQYLEYTDALQSAQIINIYNPKNSIKGF